jgi:hypothetical protein
MLLENADIADHGVVAAWAEYRRLTAEFERLERLIKVYNLPHRCEGCASGLPMCSCDDLYGIEPAQS